MMHNLPLNVVRKHVKRVIEEGMVDKNVLQHKFSLIPWTAGNVLELLQPYNILYYCT
jgi:hypothetical protein